MQKLLFYILLLLLTSILYAQEGTKIDSLKHTLSHAAADSIKLNVHLQLIQHSFKEKRNDKNKFVEAAVEYAESVQSHLPESLVQVLFESGKAYLNTGDTQQSETYLQEALANSIQNPNQPFLGKIYYHIGLNFQHKGLIDEAITNFEKAIATYRDEGDFSGIARTNNNLSAIYRDKGDINKAVSLLNESLDRLQNSEDDVLISSLYNSMGRIYKGQANYDSAHYYYTRCLERAQKINDLRILSVSYNNLGNVNQSRGELDEALANYVNSLAIKEKQGNPKSLSIAYHNVGSVKYELGHYERAKIDFEKSMEYAIVSDFKTVQVHNYRKLGDVARATGQISDAITHHEQAIQLSKSMDFKPGLAENYLNLGRDYLFKKEADISLKYFIQSLKIAEQINRKRGISLALTGIAEAYNLNQKHKNQNITKLLKNYNSIEELLLRSHQIAQEIGDLNSMTTSLEALISFYGDQDNSPKEAFYARQYIQYRDSLFNQQTANSLANWETKYNTSEKEKEILLLENEKLLNEKEKEILNTRNRFYLALAIGLITFLLFGAYLFFKLRKNKEQIEFQNLQLQKLNSTKDKFFGIIAHDIRSPIVALSGVGEQMDFYLKKNKKDKLERLAQRVDSTANHLSNLLDNLLNWALSQQGIIPYKPKQIELEPVVLNVSNMFHNNAISKDIEVRVEIPTNIHVHVDEAALNTILRNLIGNAIKFTPNKGTITISAYVKSSQVSLLISDTGVGMSEAQLNDLFSLDRKSTKGTSGEKGSGLGLTLVKELIDLNKGTIHVKNNPNAGTTFEVRFPTV